MMTLTRGVPIRVMHWRSCLSVRVWFTSLAVGLSENRACIIVIKRLISGRFWQQVGQWKEIGTAAGRIIQENPPRVRYYSKVFLSIPNRIPGLAHAIIQRQ